MPSSPSQLTNHRRGMRGEEVIFPTHEMASFGAKMGTQGETPAGSGILLSTSEGSIRAVTPHWPLGKPVIRQLASQAPLLNQVSFLVGFTAQQNLQCHQSI